jgi:hypothetical protein
MAPQSNIEARENPECLLQRPPDDLFSGQPVEGRKYFDALSMTGQTIPRHLAVEGPLAIHEWVGRRRRRVEAFDA